MSNLLRSTVSAAAVAVALFAAAPAQAEAVRSGLASYRAELDALEADLRRRYGRPVTRCAVCMR